MGGAVLGTIEPRLLKLSNILQNSIKKRISLATPSPQFLKSVSLSQARQNKDNSKVDAVRAIPSGLSRARPRRWCAGVLGPAREGGEAPRCATQSRLENWSLFRQ